MVFVSDHAEGVEFVVEVNHEDTDLVFDCVENGFGFFCYEVCSFDFLDVVNNVLFDVILNKCKNLINFYIRPSIQLLKDQFL